MTETAAPPSQGTRTLPPPSVPERRHRRWWWGAVALVVVLATALTIGSGVASSRPPSAAQRAAALDNQIRCPSCEDISVAQSTASSALAVRQEVRRLIGQGRSDQQVENALVAQYGPSILLRPPTSGLTAVVWIVPAVAGALAVAALVGLFWRRSRQLRRLRRGAS